MPAPPAIAHDVVAFWRDAGPGRWFRKDDAFDREFHERFIALHESAASGQCADWAATPEGALALCILLDQFPRNAFRGTARMFATDALARRVAHRAIDARFDDDVEPGLRQFFYLPFEHSEDPADQDLAVALTPRAGPDSYKWAVLHRDIIARFGRFPHRNDVLGRATTPAERAFLDAGGFGG